MRYIAALDYEHMDNGVFLTALGRALSQQKGMHRILVHGDSEYTERLIQTGMMREEAITRSIRDLNHRLVALFADQGVSTIGLNAYQRNLITWSGGELHLDRQYLDSLPLQPVLLLSRLVRDLDAKTLRPIPLDDFILFLNNVLQPDERFLFSLSDRDEIFVNNENLEGTLSKMEAEPAFINTHVPEDLRELPPPYRITTAGKFALLPDIDKTIRIV